MASGDEGYFHIGIAARIIKVHPQTLRHYERIGLLRPQRSEGGEKGRGIRLYSRQDIDLAAEIRRLVEDLGVNLAGVEVILNMKARAEQLEREQAARIHEYEREIQAFEGPARAGDDERAKPTARTGGQPAAPAPVSPHLPASPLHMVAEWG